MSEPLLTARQVAERLAVSPETVLRWTRRGELPAHRLPGGAIRYASATIEAWLVGRATAGAGVEESPDTPHRARRRGGYRRALVLEPPDTRPLDAVTNEEDEHAR
jgi:excisionase family DNA binding protein